MNIESLMFTNIYRIQINVETFAEKNFIILDSASTVFQLKIKEALHIQWQQPSLNKQVFMSI